MDCKCPCDYYVRTMNILMQTTTTKKIYTENTRVLECCLGLYIAVIIRGCKMFIHAYTCCMIQLTRLLHVATCVQ